MARNRIDGQVYSEIKIDKQEVPFTENFLSYVNLIEGNGLPIPVMEMFFVDTNSVFVGSSALTDGNTFEISIGKDSKNPQYTRKYRMFSHNPDNRAGGPGIRVFGLLDSPKYTMKSNRQAYSGTSVDVLRQVATECGLDFKTNVLPNDTQDIWLNVCKTRASFVTDVTKHGYANEKSGMVSALDSHQTLRYINIDAALTTPIDKITTRFLYNIDQSEGTNYKVRQSVDQSSAGLSNTQYNYGTTRYEHSLDGEHKTHSNVTLSSAGRYLPINQDVKNQLENLARVDYALFDTGNTHPKYQQALYQNQRRLALLCERVSILVWDVTDVKLYDPVVYKQANADPSKVVQESDVYIVIGKTCAIRNGSFYGERLELARYSVPLKGSAPITSTDTNMLNSPIPAPLINPTANTTQTILTNAKSISQLINSSGVAGASMQVATANYALNNNVNNAFAGGSMLRMVALLQTPNPTPQQWALAIGDMLTHLPNMQLSNTQLQQSIALAAPASTSFTNSVYQMPVSTRNTMMYQPGSMNTMTQNTMFSQRTQMYLGLALKGIDYLAPNSVKSSAVYRDFKQVVQPMHNGYTSSATNVAQVWNNNVSAANGVAAQPTPYALVTNTNATRTLTQHPTTDYGVWSTTYNQELLRTTDRGAPNYVTPNMVVQPTDVKPTPAELLATLRILESTAKMVL